MDTHQADSTEYMAVLLIITDQEEAAGLTHWGLQFSYALGAPLYIACASDSTVQKEDVYVPLAGGAEWEDAIWREIAAAVTSRPPPEQEPDGEAAPPAAPMIRAIPYRHIHQAALAEVKHTRAQLVIVGKHESQRGNHRSEHVAQTLFQKSPCTTLLIRLGESDNYTAQSLLVPAAGGPHSIEALELARAFAENLQVHVTPLFVEPDSYDIAEDVGARVLRKILQSVHLDGDERVHPVVRIADDVQKAIAKVASEGKYDLVLIGASNLGQIRRFLFGTLPQRLLTREGGTAVAVVRAPHPFMTRFTTAVEGLLDTAVPQLSRPDRIALFETLQQNSRWNFDFLALMGLSTAIASLGLLQDSTAVVIGAMLVAPLMAPLLSAGLALVQGNLPLMRSSAKAILFGFFTALAISATLGLMVPLPTLTSELLSRGGPTLLDLAVALLSGMAAAYCTARPNLSAALPGVAIAAALVPPIATTGISLALGEQVNARGAALLFGTNVVAVILGASSAFYAAGIRSYSKQPDGQRWVKHLAAILLLAAVILAFPLGSVLWTQLRAPTTATWSMRADLEPKLASQFARHNFTVTKVRGRQEEFQRILEIHVAGPDDLDQAVREDVVRLIKEHSLKPIQVRIFPTRRVDIYVEHEPQMSAAPP